MEPPEYIVAHLAEAFAADVDVSQLDVHVHLRGDDVVLQGRVQTEERKRAIEAAAGAVAAGHRIVSEIEIRDFSGTARHSPTRAARIAAIGDIHFGEDSAGRLAQHLPLLAADADLLLLAGDLTRHGTMPEIAVLIEDLSQCPVPVAAVLGNHDHHSDEEQLLAKALAANGVAVVDGDSAIFDVRGLSVGVAGTKGFGGGFAGACGSEFGERIMKDFVGHTRSLANTLGEHLSRLNTDIRLALLHFSPTPDTLRGEPPEIYPWLGSYLLAEAIDGAGCDFVFHGHAHAGTEVGATPAGVPVRNVAQPVINAPFKIYCVEPTQAGAGGIALSALATG